MLETARAIAEIPPTDIELTFVAFGAEEQGLKGSRALLAGQKLLKDTLVLNLDTVGVGSQLYLVEGSGIFRKCKTSTGANQLLRECCKRTGLQIRPHWTVFASHDHVPLLRAGLSATTLTIDKARKDRLGRVIGRLFRLPNVRTRWYPYLHSIDDTPDKIGLLNIEHTGRVVLEFIKSA
jgi:Zn-dependent M28 family amino/carboxypeptidase